MRHQLVVPLRTPSKNDIKPGPHFQAWIRERTITHRWAREIPPAGAARAAGPRSLRVIVTLAAGQKHYDIINLYAGLGPVADALVLRRWLVDDSPRYLPEVRAEEEKARAPAARTTIILEDVTTCPG